MSLLNCVTCCRLMDKRLWLRLLVSLPLVSVSLVLGRGLPSLAQILGQQVSHSYHLQLPPSVHIHPIFSADKLHQSTREEQNQQLHCRDEEIVQLRQSSARTRIALREVLTLRPMYPLDLPFYVDRPSWMSSHSRVRTIPFFYLTNNLPGIWIV